MYTDRRQCSICLYFPFILSLVGNTNHGDENTHFTTTLFYFQNNLEQLARPSITMEINYESVSLKGHYSDQHPTDMIGDVIKIKELIDVVISGIFYLIWFGL